MALHYEILDDVRRGMLPLLFRLKKKFYLAGGTGLALQIGHRESVDFDFFSRDPFAPDMLAREVTGLLSPHPIQITQEEPGTLSFIASGDIRFSFFAYPYPLVRPLISEPFLSVASEEDIAAMKLHAVVGRASMKDYIDLYYILRERPLAQLFAVAREKSPSIDPIAIAKGLVYFDDVPQEPLRFRPGFEVDFETVKDFLRGRVKEYFATGK